MPPAASIERRRMISVTNWLLAAALRVTRVGWLAAPSNGWIR